MQNLGLIIGGGKATYEFETLRSKPEAIENGYLVLK